MKIPYNTDFDIAFDLLEPCLKTSAWNPTAPSSVSVEDFCPHAILSYSMSLSVISFFLETFFSI